MGPILPLATLVLAASPLVLHVESPVTRVPLVELFTSEGCSSCPPADATLARLGAGAGAHERAVFLAYHVTYWDHLGWRDRFGSADFDRRQQQYARAWRSASVYTPAFAVDGSEVGRRALEPALAAARAERAPLRLSLDAELDPPRRRLTLAAHATWTAAPAGEPLELVLALHERRLTTRVPAGENRGRELAHDFVARWLRPAAPWPSREPRASVREVVELPAEWKLDDLGVVAFVQGRESRRVYQALASSLVPPQRGQP